MFYSIKSIASDYLRTREVSLQKDAARDYGEPERSYPKNSNTSGAGAAVFRFGLRAQNLANGEPSFDQVFRIPPDAEAPARPPQNFELLGRAVEASAQPRSTAQLQSTTGSVPPSSSADAQVPYEALLLAASSQDPANGRNPAGGFVTRLPLIGEDASPPPAQSGAPEAFVRSNNANKPFGREVPFDLQDPDGPVRQSPFQAEGTDGERVFTTSDDEVPEDAKERLSLERDTAERARMESLQRQNQAEVARVQYQRARLAGADEAVN